MRNVTRSTGALNRRDHGTGRKVKLNQPFKNQKSEGATKDSELSRHVQNYSSLTRDSTVLVLQRATTKKYKHNGLG